MAFLVHNLPPERVLVRKEYLYDLEKGHGEYTEGIWISVKSVQGKAFYFETLLPEYGSGCDIKFVLPVVTLQADNIIAIDTKKILYI